MIFYSLRKFVYNGSSIYILLLGTCEEKQIVTQDADLHGEMPFAYTLLCSLCIIVIVDASKLSSQLSNLVLNYDYSQRASHVYSEAKRVYAFRDTVLAKLR